MTTIPFTTKKASGIFVKVPEDATDTEIKSGNFLQYFYGKNDLWERRIITLPEGNWQILGLRTKTETLTEEQCDGIVEHKELYNVGKGKHIKYYLNYNEGINISAIGFSKWMYETAVESFHSLMDSLECWVVNPLGEEPKQHQYEDEFDKEGHSHGAYAEYMRNHKKWRDAESKTGNWLIIIKK